MALDLFQTSNLSKFWGVLGATAAITYIAAGVGLLTIYRKGVIDIMHTLFRKTTKKTPYSAQRRTSPQRFMEFLDDLEDKRGTAPADENLGSRTTNIAEPMFSPPKAKSLSSLRRTATSNSASSNKLTQVNSAPPTFMSPV